MTIPFALSVSHFISSVGADAGFAAIIGLAILVLLYFAQARETATLREEASSASEQVQQLEYRVAQLARGVAAAPAAAAPAPRARLGARRPAAAAGSRRCAPRPPRLPLVPSPQAGCRPRCRARPGGPGRRRRSRDGVGDPADPRF